MSRLYPGYHQFMASALAAQNEKAKTASPWCWPREGPWRRVACGRGPGTWKPTLRPGNLGRWPTP